MKRFLSLLTVTALTAMLFTACGGSGNNATNNNATNNNNAATTNNATTNDSAASNDNTATRDDNAAAAEGNQAASGALSTGLGITTSIGSSSSATAEKEGNAQVDSYIVAVTVDGDGVITKCTLDSAQTKVSFDTAGVITADKSAKVETKVEKGDAYGMKARSGIGKEWYEQAAAFGDWAVGKTINDVKSLLSKKISGNEDDPDVADLTASVTVSVDTILAAVEKAGANLKAGSDAEGDYKTGLGVVTKIGSSKDATADANGTGQVDSMIAAVTVDSTGKIVACSLDSAQTKVNFAANGELASDLSAEIKSKVELGDGYGMKKASAIGKDWYEQANAFAEWTIGKTISEVKGLQTKKVDDNHPNVPDDAELSASVTVDAGDFIAAIEKAVANAK